MSTTEAFPGLPAKRDVTPIPKGGGKSKAAKAKPSAKKAPAKKTAANKAPVAKKTAAKKAASSIVRALSSVSKEGTQKDAFTGEVLPVTAFPTMKNAAGETIRGPVARVNLEAYRAANKVARAEARAAKEAEKAAKAAAKAAKAAAKAATE